MNKIELGDIKCYLKYYRESKKLTQAQLASLIGVSKNSISSLETGEFYPSLKVAYRLSVVLDVPVHLIFDGHYWTDNHEFVTVADIDKKYYKVGDYIG